MKENNYFFLFEVLGKLPYTWSTIFYYTGCVCVCVCGGVGGGAGVHIFTFFSFIKLGQTAVPIIFSVTMSDIVLV